MQRLCFSLTLKVGTEGEYQRRHDEIWPELTREISAAGITNYTLFRRGLQVIGYAECRPDIDTARAELTATEVSSMWSAHMDDIIEQSTDEQGNLLRAEEVWHLD